jgi:AcrR family transcriptional regulator
MPETGSVSGMLMFMRALPGRDLRVTVGAPPVAVTRSSVHLDQRRRILRAVADVAAERGYAGVTLELVAKRARVSYKTFYKHFSSKDECFMALFDDVTNFTEETIRARLAAAPGPWADQVALALRTLVDLILAEPVLARAAIVEVLSLGPAVRERYEKATEPLVSLFRAGRQLNLRGSELPARIEETLAGAVLWSAYQRLVVNEADHLSEVLPELLELVLRSYLGQEEARRLARAQLDPEPTPA